MRKKKALFCVLAALMMISLMVTPKVFAALAAETESWTISDVTEFNAYSPSAAKTFAGQRMQGYFQVGYTTYVCPTVSATLCDDVATTATTSTALVYTGTAMGQSLALADGFQNQQITYVLVTDGGQNFTVTPDTKSGFTSVQLDDANDSVTLKYIDDTVGWVIVGNNAATIN